MPKGSPKCLSGVAKHLTATIAFCATPVDISATRDAFKYDGVGGGVAVCEMVLEPRRPVCISSIGQLGLGIFTTENA